jgi:hypothetical protein
VAISQVTIESKKETTHQKRYAMEDGLSIPFFEINFSQHYDFEIPLADALLFFFGNQLINKKMIYWHIFWIFNEEIIKNGGFDT